jgi:hypothetical protein
MENHKIKIYNTQENVIIRSKNMHSSKPALSFRYISNNKKLLKKAMKNSMLKKGGVTKKFAKTMIIKSRDIRRVFKIRPSRLSTMSTA